MVSKRPLSETRRPAKDETFIFSRSTPFGSLVLSTNDYARAGQPDDHDDRDGRQSEFGYDAPQATVETFTQVPDYTVTFQADGATVKTMTVEDGYVLKDSDYPAVPTKTGYTGEWVKYTSAVHSNVTVQAKYTAVVAKYTVTFKADNTVVKTMTVKDGYTLKASDYPTVPQKRLHRRMGEVYVGNSQQCHGAGEIYGSRDKIYRVLQSGRLFTVKAIPVNDGYVLQDADYPEVPAKVGCNGAWEKHTAAIHKQCDD